MIPPDSHWKTGKKISIIKHLHSLHLRTEDALHWKIDLKNDSVIFSMRWLVQTLKGIRSLAAEHTG